MKDGFVSVCFDHAEKQQLKALRGWILVTRAHQVRNFSPSLVISHAVPAWLTSPAWSYSLHISFFFPFLLPVRVYCAFDLSLLFMFVLMHNSGVGNRVCWALIKAAAVLMGVQVFRSHGWRGIKTRTPMLSWMNARWYLERSICLLLTECCGCCFFMHYVKQIKVALLSHILQGV